VSLHDCHYDLGVVVECGCMFERCNKCGIGHIVHKCVQHSPRQHHSPSYYLDELKGHTDRVPSHNSVAQEYRTALAEINRPLEMCQRGCKAIDVGAGIGHYAPWIMSSGYSYEALELDSWASEYIRSSFGVPVYNMPFDEFNPTEQYDLVISGHCLEHLPDARTGLTKMTNMLKKGGRLLLLIPNYQDKGNPDHWWLFTEVGMRQWLAELGYIDISSIPKRIVQHELFMYFSAILT